LKLWKPVSWELWNPEFSIPRNLKILCPRYLKANPSNFELNLLSSFWCYEFDWLIAIILSFSLKLYLTKTLQPYNYRSVFDIFQENFRISQKISWANFGFLIILQCRLLDEHFYSKISALQLLPKRIKTIFCNFPRKFHFFLNLSKQSLQLTS
jgi:hypothetical protein